MIDAEVAIVEHVGMQARTCRSTSSCSTATASAGLQMLEPSSGRSALFSAPAATSTKLKAGSLPLAVVHGCSQRHQGQDHSAVSAVGVTSRPHHCSASIVLNVVSVVRVSIVRMQHRYVA